MQQVEQQVEQQVKLAMNLATKHGYGTICFEASFLTSKRALVFNRNCLRWDLKFEMRVILQFLHLKYNVMNHVLILHPMQRRSSKPLLSTARDIQRLPHTYLD